MDKTFDKHIHFIVFVVIILVQAFLLIFNTSTYGGADNISHFQIAKYSFKYPELFLDHWGKPVFTSLLAPFTLFGFKVAKGFNLIIGVLTLLIVSKLANHIYRGSSIFTIILIAFSPVYFSLMNSCLTEVLFSFVLVSAVYFFYANKPILAAVILSFIPFVRTEGIVILPVFALAFLLKRSYWAIVFLLVGTFFYTIIGYFVFSDILWLIHKMPYSTGESIYGSGNLFHFIKKSNYIFGIPFLVVLVPGLVIWGFQNFKKFSFRNENFILFIVIAGSWLTYFAAHSYVWWKGTGGSLGLIRVMGGIIPLAALTSVRTIKFVFKKLRNKYVSYAVLSAIIILQVVWLFVKNDFPLKADPTEQLIKKSADYIHYSEEGKKVFYFNPLLIHFLDIDPYDVSKCNWGIADKNQPSNSMEWGDIMVWDAHFGSNEGGVKLDVLEADPNLKKVKSLYPMEKVTVLGGYDYSVQIFKKSVNKNDTTVISDSCEQVLSFEKYLDKRVIDVDGYKVWHLDSIQEYSPSITLSPNDVKRHELLDVSIKLHYKALQPLVASETLLIFSVKNDEENLRYEKVDLVSDGTNWEELQLNVKMPANIPIASKILVYIWNKDRKSVLIERMTVKVESY